jgi:hypothetical protein
MAITRPSLVVPGQNITAAFLDTYLRDNLNGLHWLGAYQTADVVKNNDATLANLTGLTFPVVSGDVWVFLAHSFADSGATPDAKWAVTAPGGSTGRYGILGVASGLGDLSTATFGTGLARAFPAGNEDNQLIGGYVTAGANGSVQIQAAQNTATAVDTTFRQYSPLVAFRVSTPGNLPIPDFAAAQVLTATNLSTYIGTGLNDLRYQYGFMREELVKNQETNLEDLLGMSFRVRSGEIWAFFSFLYFVSSSVADIKFAVTAPDTSAGRYGVVGNGAPITAASTSTFGGAIAFEVAGTLDDQCSLNGLVSAGADGIVQLQMAQNTSTAVNTTVYQDSFFVAFRL